MMDDGYGELTPPRPSHSDSNTPSPKSSGAGDDGARGSQVAHTLTACCRCRHRKTRCDPGLPRCTPCKKNNAVCEYFDAAKGKKMPRAYVIHLQDRVRELEHELESLTHEPPPSFDVERLVRGAGLVKIKDSDEFPRFLGPSSGISMTRLVMEMAKDLCNAKSIKEIVPEHKALEVKQRFAEEVSKPTSKVYPMISFVAAPSLPSIDLTNELVQNFNLKAQYLYPVFHEPSFRDVVRDVYQGSSDPFQNFALRMVIAISMQKLDTTYAGLADSYYLAALQQLEKVLRAKNMGSLQALMLIGMYSMTTPTRTAAYWVVGLATKLCQELGMADEATISYDEHAQPLDAIQTDLRRRLGWMCFSMELGLAHSLGRPSAFAMSYDHVDLQPFLMVDDQHITSSGIVPGSPVSMKKRIAMHFMKMRLLQLEIRQTLYQQKRSSPASDADPWFKQMEAKLNDWMASCPRNDEGSGISEIWFKARYNTMIVFLFRPSPQVPQPSARAAQQCFEACKFNVHVQKQQIQTKSVDLTWIFAQTLFMCINTIMWTLSYPQIRQEHPKAECEQHLQTALEAIYLTSRKWPGVESALELYGTLVEACRKAYDGDTEASYGPSQSPPVHVSDPAKHQHPHAPPPLSDASPVNAAAKPAPVLAHSYGPPEMQLPQALPPKLAPNGQYARTVEATAPPLTAAAYSAAPLTSPAYNAAAPAATHSLPFDPTSYSNPLPAPLHYSISPTATESMLERNMFYGPFGDAYGPLLHAGHFAPEHVNGLSLEQQSELMDNLEASGLGRQLRETSPAQSLYTIGYVF